MVDLADLHENEEPDRRQSSEQVHDGKGPLDFLVVGIGASAGGLEPCQSLVSAISRKSGIACIIVQHLDPSHESMMVGLLAGHTDMTVLLARDGMQVDPGFVYVIPPGTYLSMRKGTLLLSKADRPQGARLPFDHLLRSLAADCGRRTACVVLSGGGADGSVGLEAIKASRGFVIAQDPSEAQHDGMPRSAISTGAVDVVLPVSAMPAALFGYVRQLQLSPSRLPRSPELMQSHLKEITKLLQKTTAQDFSLYKPGTVHRRIDRRMAIVGIEGRDVSRYLTLLRGDAREVELLAKDLLIHVTGFFRDPIVFEMLSSEIIPILIRELPRNRPLRVWVPGCSTGEEAYSLAMIFQEQIALAGGGEQLQIFASDVDSDSIGVARSGYYSEAQIADVTPARVARFFSKEGNGYRVSADLRASVVFTVQDVLADPPFSRIDLISCRNLLIYLGVDAQKKVISLFHFAIREGGALLLGNTETVGNPDGRFEVIREGERLYRQAGGKRSPDAFLPFNSANPDRREIGSLSSGHLKATLADMCRDLLVEIYAPAGVLVDHANACLFFFGRADHYLQVSPGNAAQDVLALAPAGVRGKLRSAILRARREAASVLVTGGYITKTAARHAFEIAVHPVPRGAHGMLLICFLDKPEGHERLEQHVESARTVELEKEVDGLRIELEGALRSHEVFGEEQKAASEEALSVNEEYQSTNEELVSSKEELQSLNEELSALNNQLQETLEQQRSTSNDLQNVLFSTTVATLFLDLDLRIRFFTPTIQKFFGVIPSDIGRALFNFASLTLDQRLLDDVRTVLATEVAIEREIVSPQSVWFSRSILPYRAHTLAVEGVVITFTDITDRKRAAHALEVAKQEAERANAAKTRFLAAASHDLRQPLQSLKLLLGLLHKVGDLNQVKGIADRSDGALSVMAGMLNTLLDINQIEAGAVTAEIENFPVNRLLEELRREFSQQADAQGLDLRVIPCSLYVSTDPRLLEQMIRNLLSNAMKYTKRGKVLLGCRRRGAVLGLEIWDTGIGIPSTNLKAIFEEYHQVDNAARDKGKGLGLGLAIVQRLGDLLGHRIRVRSDHGKGSVFAVDVAVVFKPSKPSANVLEIPIEEVILGSKAIVLIVEDDADVLELLRLYIDGQGHTVIAAGDGAQALELAAKHETGPDLILADYNLPDGLDGIKVATMLRGKCRRAIPAIILTGDVTSDAARAIAAGNCVQLTKPVDVRRLKLVIQELLVASSPSPPIVPSVKNSTASVRIYVVDDDDNVRAAIRSVLEASGHVVEDFTTCESFLASYDSTRVACLLIDAYMTGMDGFGLLERLAELGHAPPAIMITGRGDVQMAVRAMKAGVSDFLEKPVGHTELLASIERALGQGRNVDKRHAIKQEAVDHLAGLTARQRQIMGLVLAGHPSKNIAADLGISQRTVENHRAEVMRRTGTKSLPALARLSYTASTQDDAA